jgi:hypothetical protein
LAKVFVGDVLERELLGMRIRSQIRAWGTHVFLWDAFVDAVEVRRGVEADAEAGFAGDGGQGGGGGSFAVGAGDENGWELPLGVAERGAEDADFLRARICGVLGWLDDSGVGHATLFYFGVQMCC